MISSRLLSLVRCPDCHGTLEPPGSTADFRTRGPSDPRTLGPSDHSLKCAGCGRRYESPADYLDLRPLEKYAEQTKYLDEALHVDARHERVSPPLLGSRVRNDMLRRFLAPGPGEVVLDLGCGSGRALLWNRDMGAAMIGVDIAPFFSRDARLQMDLMLGDLRKLPFADATFDKAWSLDVLEHLSPEALAGMLGETARVLKPGGSLFVYTHVRKNARIAAGLRWINRLAHGLERRGLIDLRQEHLRKSDHVNPLRDIPHLQQVTAAAGFRIARIRFYTPIVGGFVENILVRVAERAMAKRVESTAGDEAAVREVRSAAKERIARRGPTYGALLALSWIMKLDVLLFGRITSGPFFALLVKER
jgi:SAM-dependent methyltransferase